MSKDTINAGPLDRDALEKVRALVERDGEDKTAEALGISRHTVSRARGGLALYRGTRTLIKQRLESLAVSDHSRTISKEA